MDSSAKQEYLLKEANRKSLERSKETAEKRESRKLVDACKHLESRENESNLKHISRTTLQNERQKLLLSKETLEQKKVRQDADSLRKVEKRAKKASAYENSSDPNKDWNLKLNADMTRHYNSRKNETDEKKKLRKERDAKYQKNKRLTEKESKEKRRKKRDYNQKRKINSAAKKSEEWSKIHRQNNLEQLKESGSYYRFLCNGKPRSTFFGRSLPTQPEIVGDWKWLINEIYNRTAMGSDFYSQSKKAALVFQNYGLIHHDIVHIITGRHNSTLMTLGGAWIIGGICSLSDVTDVETIKHQVS